MNSVHDSRPKAGQNSHNTWFIPYVTVTDGNAWNTPGIINGGVHTRTERRAPSSASSSPRVLSGIRGLGERLQSDLIWSFEEIEHLGFQDDACCVAFSQISMTPEMITEGLPNDQAVCFRVWEISNLQSDSVKGVRDIRLGPIGTTLVGVILIMICSSSLALVAVKHICEIVSIVHAT